MKQEKIIKIVLGILIFIVSPILSWVSILASDESAVFASLSRMIWYSGSSFQIFIAMLVMFVSMMFSFFYACIKQEIKKYKKIKCVVTMLLGVIVLYIGAMWIMPSDGNTMTKENIWHGILSFGGILIIFISFCLYTIFLYKIDKNAFWIISLFLVFTLITEMFAVFNVFDEKSYVIVSAISELYVLTMLSIISYLSLYFSCKYKSIEKEFDSCSIASK